MEESVHVKASNGQSVKRFSNALLTGAYNIMPAREGLSIVRDGV